MIYAIALILIIVYSIVLWEDSVQGSVALPVLFLCAVLSALLFLNLTSLTDPGFIPRKDLMLLEPEAYQ